MNVTDLEPGDDYDKIQKAMDDGSEEVHFHAVGKKGSGPFDLGKAAATGEPNIIKVTKAKKIRGVPDPDNSAKKPIIKGSSGRLMKDGVDCGIFSIRAAGSVEISGLCLEHDPTANPAQDDDWHGSATISYFVDNKQESSLTVTDCEISTYATSAINIVAMDEVADTPTRHDFIIRNCTMKGQIKNSPDPGSGNYISVKLGGSFNSVLPPVDMRGSHFEVSGCQLDPPKFPAVAVWKHLSDSASMFVVANNDIGNNSGPGKATAVGILFGFPILLPTFVKGAVLVLDNKIRTGSQFHSIPGVGCGSMGICVIVKKEIDSAESLRTIMSGNEIHLAHSESPSELKEEDGIWKELHLDKNGNQKWHELNLDGIVYWDLAAPPEGSVNTNAAISRNVVVSDGVVRPLRGIHLCGPAHDVIVADNDLTGLTASQTHILADKDVHNCVFQGNLLGPLGVLQAKNKDEAKPVAALRCEGRSNWLSDNDFRKTDPPGWQLPDYLGGPGCVALGPDSEENLLVLDAKNFASLSALKVPPCNTWWWGGNKKQWQADENLNKVVILAKYIGPLAIPHPHPRPFWGWVVEMLKEFMWKKTHKVPVEGSGPPATGGPGGA